MRISSLFIAASSVLVVVAWMAPSSFGQSNQGQNTGMVAGKGMADTTQKTVGKQVIVTKIPSGYRDWKFVSAAHEAGNSTTSVL